MATGKKVFLAFTDLDKDSLLNSTQPSLQKARQKGAVAPLAVQENLRAEAASGAAASVAGQLLWDAAKEHEFVVADFDNGGDLWVAEPASEAELGELLDKAYAAGGKKILVVILGRDTVIFSGLGIERGLALDKAVSAMGVAPTIAWVADLPLPAQVEAAVIYPVLKGLNFKMKEVHKIHDSMNSMLAAMERNTRQPWDKHDCA